MHSGPADVHHHHPRTHAPNPTQPNLTGPNPTQTSITRPQARVSFRRIEEFLSRSADDVRNEEAYGKTDSDRHCPDLKKGQLKIENGEG